MRIESVILSSLLYNEEYMRKVLPYIREEYFPTNSDKVIFNEIDNFVKKYKTKPDKNIILLELEQTQLPEGLYDSSKELLVSLDESDYDFNWLLDKTESWCKDRAIYNALMESIKIADGEDQNKEKGAIIDILNDALSVGFEDKVGHDYIEDVDKRYDFYHQDVERIALDLTLFNKITKGGLPNKTLSVVMASTGVGKSLFMCHAAASTLSLGKNVLYITLELSEERIAERIDANLLNITIDDLVSLPKEIFQNKINQIAKKTMGRLFIKEFPTALAHVGHFRSLINELKLKKEFTPDIVFIDYLNICSSYRFKTNNVNSYTFAKAIAEEIRGLAVELNVPIVSATQTNRTGYQNNDIDLDSTSESFGVPSTADFMFALMQTEELKNLNQVMVKQLKNRFSSIDYYKRFVIGIDKSKMKLYDVDASGQDTILDKDEDFVYEESSYSRNFSDFKI